MMERRKRGTKRWDENGGGGGDEDRKKNTWLVVLLRRWKMWLRRWTTGGRHQASSETQGDAETETKRVIDRHREEKRRMNTEKVIEIQWRWRRARQRQAEKDREEGKREELKEEEEEEGVEEKKETKRIDCVTAERDAGSMLRERKRESNDHTKRKLEGHRERERERLLLVFHDKLQLRPITGDRMQSRAIHQSLQSIATQRHDGDHHHHHYQLLLLLQLFGWTPQRSPSWTLFSLLIPARNSIYS